MALDGRDIALIAVACDEIFFGPGRNRDQACGFLPVRGRAVIQTADKQQIYIASVSLMMYVAMRASAQVSKTGRAEQKGTMMKAVRLHRQGGPEQLVYEDAPKPELGAGDALIRVHATGITPAELTYTETYTNCDGSARLPAIPGHEVSGVVESVADGVSDVSIGDEVYALTSFCRDGAAADYVAVHAADLAPKPKTIDHMQAAAVPLSALTAWQAFFDHAQLAPGQRVLIHGASGGVGSFAVQIARWHGAYVVGTASAENRDFLLRLGANEVIDYRHAPFEQAVREVDVVLDTIGGETRERSWQVLKPTGILVSLPGPIPESEGPAHGKRGVFFIVQPNREQLGKIAALIDSGVIRPVIAETIPLAKARQAFERGVAGHTRGKLVLAVDKP
jgi:NADPH:quinone reductase-like Zn-dependent oxidoreductase